jgi:hypothetical protein
MASQVLANTGIAICNANDADDLKDVALEIPVFPEFLNE